jgi:pimeloyl-ACP methyl ester carboxylesterase
MRPSASITAVLCVVTAGAALGQAPRTAFVTVEPDVRLEVLDWGGSGRPVVLLAGNGQTAHSFDRFAPLLAQHYRVYSITRRGFGASSKPATGYLAERLADDVLAVMDSLGLERPVLAGHSRAGQELSSIGGRYPKKVAGLVYLDAGYNYALYDSTRGDYSIDVAEMKRRLDRFQDATNRGQLKTMDSLLTTLLRVDLPALQRDLTTMQNTLSDFREGQTLGPPRATGIAGALADGLQRHTRIDAPVLAIFNVTGAPAGVGTDSAVTRAWLRTVGEAPGRFARGVPQARVVVLPNASHFVFDSNPADVLREMRAFIDSLPTR